MEVSLKKRILIVEDEASLSDTLARRFSRRGFEVVEAADPQVALEHLAEHPFDIVICDISLRPEMSGLDLMRALKERGNPAPLIFLTGHGPASAEAMEALDLGALAVFSKPTDFHVLLNKVCSVLGMAAQSVSVPGIS